MRLSMSIIACVFIVAGYFGKPCYEPYQYAQKLSKVYINQSDGRQEKLVKFKWNKKKTKIASVKFKKTRVKGVKNTEPNVTCFSFSKFLEGPRSKFFYDQTFVTSLHNCLQQDRGPPIN